MAVYESARRNPTLSGKEVTALQSLVDVTTTENVLDPTQVPSIGETGRLLVRDPPTHYVRFLYRHSYESVRSSALFAPLIQDEMSGTTG